MNVYLKRDMFKTIQICRRDDQDTELFSGYSDRNIKIESSIFHTLKNMFLKSLRGYGVGGAQLTKGESLSRKYDIIKMDY